MRRAAGSGKTHTLFGTAAEAGLVPMLAEELFQKLEELPASCAWRVECAVMEIYNERVRAHALARAPPPPARRATAPPRRCARTRLRDATPPLRRRRAAQLLVCV